jgi:hypothetical protein
MLEGRLRKTEPGVEVGSADSDSDSADHGGETVGSTLESGVGSQRHLDAERPIGVVDVLRVEQSRELFLQVSGQ